MLSITDCLVHKCKRWNVLKTENSTFYISQKMQHLFIAWISSSARFLVVNFKMFILDSSIFYWRYILKEHFYIYRLCVLCKKFIFCSMKNTTCSMKYTVCSMKYTVCSTKYTICSMKYMFYELHKNVFYEMHWYLQVSFNILYGALWRTWWPWE